MRIALASQWYPPEGATDVPYTMAHALAARGHEVHVVTGFPNYPQGTLYPGYSIRPYLREQDGDVAVHRGPLYPNHDQSAGRRAANYLSFAAGASLAAARVPRPDVWLTNGTPVTAAVPAALWSALQRVPHAMVVQDLWPESVTESGFTSSGTAARLERVLRPASDFLYRRADALGVISPGMRATLVARGVDDKAICYTPNAVGDGHLLPAVADRAALRRELSLPTEGRLFMYAGNLGELQNLENLLRAFLMAPQAHLVLVGSGVARERLMQQAGEAPNITFVDRQPLDQIGRYIAASDVQVVSLEDSPLLRVTMPSKVQTSLASGRPILAHAAGDAADVVTGLGAGLAGHPGDPRATAQAIATMMSLSSIELDRMGACGRAAYETNYTPAATGERLENLLMTAQSRRTHD